MKSIVNHTPVTCWGNNTASGILNGFCNISIIDRLTKSFVTCLHAISLSNNKNELSELMSQMRNIDVYIDNYFIYGFEPDHMWVKQVDSSGKIQGENIIVVELN